MPVHSRHDGWACSVEVHACTHASIHLDEKFDTEVFILDVWNCYHKGQSHLCYEQSLFSYHPVGSVIHLDMFRTCFVSCSRLDRTGLVPNWAPIDDLCFLHPIIKYWWSSFEWCGAPKQNSDNHSKPGIEESSTLVVNGPLTKTMHTLLQTTGICNDQLGGMIWARMEMHGIYSAAVL